MLDVINYNIAEINKYFVNSIFIFMDYTWSEIKFETRKFKIIVSDGDNNKKGNTTANDLKLITFLNLFLNLNELRSILENSLNSKIEKKR